MEKKTECPVCYQAVNKHRIEDHLRSHTGVKPYKCDQCDKKFAYKSSLRIHSRIHTGEPQPTKKASHVCQECHNKVFSTKKSLENHVNIIHSGKFPFECVFCKKKFKSQRTMLTHMKIHTGVDVNKQKMKAKSKEKNECDLCCKKFSSRRTYLSHQIVHSKELPFQCEDCGKKFRGKHHLINNHIKIHIGVKRYECSFCQKLFISGSNLISHLRVHSDETPHECKFCDKRFRFKSNLVCHVRLHTGEKPFKCQFCDKRFRENRNKKEHESTHTGEKLLKCGICRKRYGSHNGLRYHMRIFHTNAKLIKGDLNNDKELRIIVALPEEEPAGHKNTNDSNFSEEKFNENGFVLNKFGLRRCTVVVKRLGYIDFAAENGFRSVHLTKKGRGSFKLLQ